MVVRAYVNQKIKEYLLLLMQEAEIESNPELYFLWQMTLLK